MADEVTRYITLACPYCGDYMEFFDEGVDAQGRRFDLYLCLDCGQQVEIGQGDPRMTPPRYPWDPPDGFYST